MMRPAYWRKDESALMISNPVLPGFNADPSICRIETRPAVFGPKIHQQAADSTTYYNRHNFHSLVVTHEVGVSRVLSPLSCNGDYPEAALELPLKQRHPVVDGTV